MPNAIDSLLFADATAQAEEIRSGRVSATELTQAYLDAIDRIDGSLRFYVTVTADAARAAARAADARIREHEPALPPGPGGGLTQGPYPDVSQ